MTDKEIIQAFEDFVREQTAGYTSVLEFGDKRDASIEKELDLLDSVFDLINRKQAEIEILQNNLAISKKETKRYATRRVEEDWIVTSHRAIFKGKERQSIKEEAIKEFIDRLKKRSHLVLPPFGYHICADEWVIYEEDIDDTYNEMVGEQE
jgi:hypothetical protein